LAPWFRKACAERLDCAQSAGEARPHGKSSFILGGVSDCAQRLGGKQCRRRENASGPADCRSGAAPRLHQRA